MFMYNVGVLVFMYILSQELLKRGLLGEIPVWFTCTYELYMHVCTTVNVHVLITCTCTCSLLYYFLYYSISSCVSIERLSHITNITNIVISMDFTRKHLSDFIHKLTRHIMNTSEDDTKSLLALVCVSLLYLIMI